MSELRPRIESLITLLLLAAAIVCVGCSESTARIPATKSDGLRSVLVLPPETEQRIAALERGLAELKAAEQAIEESKWGTTEYHPDCSATYYGPLLPVK